MVLSAAFKWSFESGDSSGAALAHKGLCAIIQKQLFSGDGSSTGSVIPASFWQRAQQQVEEQDAQNSNGSATTPAPSPAGQASDGAEAAQALASMSAAAAQASSNSSSSDTGSACTPDILQASGPIANSEIVDILSEAQSAAQTAGLAPDSAVPSGGPGTYLDFGEEAAPETPVNTAITPAPPAPPAPPPPMAQPEAPTGMAHPPPAAPDTPPPSPSQLIRTQTFYQILGLSNLSSFEEIHLKFLRIMRRLLRSRYSADSPIRDMREFREVLRTICVAHDVLKDPHTRTDYDLRQMGMRANPGQFADGFDGKAPRTRLMLGELLECANILEPTELEIALDMHKAEPGIQFGEFLVRAGFLNQEELDSAIYAQKLINTGKITVAQFQTAMWRMRDEGTSFFDTLMIEGWLSPRDIFDPNSDLWETPSMHTPTDVPPPATPATRAAMPAPWVEDPSLIEAASAPPETETATFESGAATVKKFSGANARPEWADNLDWGDQQESGEPSNESSSNNNSDTTGAHHSGVEETAMATSGRQKRMHFSDGWTEKDTLAETQSIDVKTFRAVLEACGEEAKDD